MLILPPPGVTNYHECLTCLAAALYSIQTARRHMIDKHTYTYVHIYIYIYKYGQYCLAKKDGRRCELHAVSRFVFLFVLQSLMCSISSVRVRRFRFFPLPISVFVRYIVSVGFCPYCSHAPSSSSLRARLFLLIFVGVDLLLVAGPIGRR
jgi:hypothetical protein